MLVSRATAAHLMPERVIECEHLPLDKGARDSSREDQEVLLALTRQMDQEMTLERQRRFMLEEDKWAL